MQDALLKTTIAIDGAGAQVPADNFDLGTIDSRFRDSVHSPGLAEGFFMCFMVTTALAATETVMPTIEDSANDSSYAVIAEVGVQSSAQPAVGTKWRLPLPANCRRYVRPAVNVGTYNSGTGVLTAWIERGASA